MSLLLLLACRPDPPPPDPTADSGTATPAETADTASSTGGPGVWPDPLVRGTELTLDTPKSELVDVVWSERTLLAVRQEQGGDGGLWAFDASDPSAPVLVDRTSLGHLQRVCWDGTWAWATSRTGRVFRIRVGGGEVTVEEQWSRGDWTEGIACDGARVAWGLGSAGGEVAILDAAGDLETVVPLDTEVRDALWLDGQLWTTSYSTLTRWVLDEDSATAEATLDLTGACLDLSTNGERIAVACGTEGLHLVDPTGPTLLGSWEGHLSVRAADLEGTIAAVAGWSEAALIDVSDPGATRLVAAETASHAAMAVALEDAYLAVADWKQGWIAERLGGDSPEVRALEAWATPGDQVLVSNDGTAPLWLGTPDAGELDAASLAPGETTHWSIPEDVADSVSVATDDPDEPTLTVPVGGVDGLSVGDTAPLFLEPDLHGQAWELEALRGEVVFLGLLNKG